MWERFNNITNAEEVVEARSKFEPIKAGVYDAKLEKMEPTTAKSSGMPMLMAQFRTTENKVVFFNQVLQSASNPKATAFLVGRAVKFVSDINGEDVGFKNLGAFAKDVEKVAEDKIGEEYKIKVSYNEKDYLELEVLDPMDEDDVFEDVDVADPDFI